MKSIFKRIVTYSLLFITIFILLYLYKVYSYLYNGKGALEVEIKIDTADPEDLRLIKVINNSPRGKEKLFKFNGQYFIAKSQYIKEIYIVAPEKTVNGIKAITVSNNDKVIKYTDIIKLTSSWQSEDNEGQENLLTLKIQDNIKYSNSMVFPSVINWIGDIKLFIVNLDIHLFISAYMLSMFLFLIFISTRRVITKLKRLIYEIYSDKVLLISLLFTFCVSVFGITWGGGEPWNPDQMAIGFINIYDLEPAFFFKPPFHTYLNYFVVLYPLSLLDGIININPVLLNSLQLILSRLLTISLLLGSILLVYKIIKNIFGSFVAQVVTMIFASSAGFIHYAHFLTVDNPVVFWMLLSFYFSYKILFDNKMKYYLLAGFFCGIAAATKYNGLGVGIAIPMAHILFYGIKNWKLWLFDKKFYFSMSFVIIGFFIFNPYTIVNFRQFMFDYEYVYATYNYIGDKTSPSFITFFEHIKDIVGLPFFILFCISSLYTFYYLFKSKDKKSRNIILVLWAVFSLYFYKIGSFPRVEVRTILPIVPYFIMLSSCFLYNIQKYKRILLSLVSIFLVYNIICSAFIGIRFLSDPRMEFIKWAEDNIEKGSTIESSMYSPELRKHFNNSFKISYMPEINVVQKSFEKKMSKETIEHFYEDELPLDEINWYTREKLIDRSPEYVMINSRDFNRYYVSTNSFPHYSSVREFFDSLIDEEYSYKVVYDKQSRDFSSWLYPKKIAFLNNRMILLKRESNK